MPDARCPDDFRLLNAKHHSSLHVPALFWIVSSSQRIPRTESVAVSLSQI